MKKNLLLMMVCCSVILAAQNGVTVSNLAVDAGTVTFNVSWEKPIPVEVWVDSAWVFVDYNNNGVMERLPLLPGATLTATSPSGKVIEEPDNNKGVWVAGNARTEGSFSATVKLLTAIKDVGGACVYGSNYPPVGKCSISVDKVSISFTGTPPYDLILNTGSGTTSVQAYSTYNLFAGQMLQSFTDKTGAPGIIILGFFQPQGSCTYTEPAWVETFASFNPSNVGSSTYVSLMDERDNKIYPVLKMGDRWIMARNLNYQEGLTWQANANSPSTVTGGTVTALIGSFWCPGSYTTVTSTRESCEVWGALYSWETAMSFDGKGSWEESPNTYCTGAANTAACKVNHGRTSSSSGREGRGICPPNWHVPTDFEWGVFFDAVEGGGTYTAHQNALGNDWFGTNACKYSKSTCTGTASDSDPFWINHANKGTDTYGFRGLPSGLRNNNGSSFLYQGTSAYFWSSSVTDSSIARYRRFNYDYATVSHWTTTRSYGFSVRCIRD
jgi:uncharacterized protein (TIGR02145 family)